MAVLLCIASFGAGALDHTDVYYSAVDGGGWGVFVVQSDTFQFLAFFIFDQNGKPTWYSCQLTLDQSSNYFGTLYASTGSYFAAPWDPSVQHTVSTGTCSFAPGADVYHTTLTYTLTGGRRSSRQSSGYR